MKKTILAVTALVLFSTGIKSQTNSGGSDFNTISPKSKSEGNSKKSSEDDEEKAFKEGGINITVGYGFPDMYKSYLKAIANNINANSSGGGILSVKGVGPAFLKLEYALSKLIGLGAVVAYHRISVTDTYDYTDSYYNSSTSSYVYGNYTDVGKVTYTSLTFAARLNFHFATGKKLDPYAGIGAGYSSKNYDLTYTTNNPNRVNDVPQSVQGYFPVYFAVSAGLRYYFTPNIGIYGEVGFDKWSVMQGGLAIKF